MLNGHELGVGDGLARRRPARAAVALVEAGFRHVATEGTVHMSDLYCHDRWPHDLPWTIA